MTTNQNSTLRRFRITNTTSGLDLGVYEAVDEMGALDAMARDAGYADHASASEVAPVEPGELSVVEVGEDVPATSADLSPDEAAAYILEIEGAESTIEVDLVWNRLYAGPNDADPLPRFYRILSAGLTYDEEAGRAREAGLGELAAVMDHMESRCWEIDKDRRPVPALSNEEIVDGLVEGLNTYEGENIWEDVVRHLPGYNDAATAALDPTGRSDVVALDIGGTRYVLRYGEASRCWVESEFEGSLLRPEFE